MIGRCRTACALSKIYHFDGGFLRTIVIGARYNSWTNHNAPMARVHQDKLEAGEVKGARAL